MKSKPFGNGGPDVSVIGQGTWYLDRGDRKKAIAALRRGIETGMTHIDTAEMYGDAELVIADAIAGNAPLTVNAVKYIANEVYRPESERNLQKAADMVSQCFASKDYVEGRTAFMEKRKPVFTGT